jgi:photosystem II stability/assembly factor-like uncharacterized protein
MFKNLKHMKLIIILLLTTLFWGACSTNSTGPDEETKRPKANSLATGSLNQVFVSTTEGLYHSLDNGETWKSLNNFYCSLVAVSPSGTIYFTYLTPDGKYTNNEKLWRSTDGGITFQVTEWVNRESVFGLVWLTFNTQEHLFGFKSLSGLYRSTTRGESWERIPGGGIIDVNPLIAPDDLFIALSDGIYRSNDNGDNWLKVLELNDVSGDTSYYHKALAFNSSGEIFAGINAWHFLGDSVETTGMIYRSDDNGNNWIKTAALNSDITHLTVNSEDNIFAITEQNEVFSSTNNGIHWNKVSVISPEEWIRTLIISSNDHLFIITRNNQGVNHIFRSLNDGVTWESIWPYF